MSHYEILVTFNKRFFFATAPRSARDQKDMERLRDEFKARFPESEGFGVHVTHWQAKGTVLE